MGYRKYELSTINMLYSLKNFGHITPLPGHNGHLSTTATFFCPQGGPFGDVRLEYLSEAGGLALYTYLSLT